MKRRSVLAALSAVFLLGGCAFMGGVRDSDVAALESRIQSLSQRIDQLESGQPASSAPASGFEASQEQQPARQSASAFGWYGAMNKLLRGLTNVFTGWVEIPKRVQETSTKSGALSGFTWGLLRGFGHGFIRTAGGLYETFTFPFPAPPGYRPVIEPPYVFVPEQPQAY